MKMYFLLIITLVSSCNLSKTQEKDFKLDLWDYNSSMAYTLHYHFDNEGMFVRRIGSLEKELTDTLEKRSLGEKEREIISNFLFGMPLDSLKNEYINTLIEDGDQKKIEIVIEMKAKTIMISNIYQKDISLLIDILNQFLTEKLKIEYEKEH